MNQYLNDFVTLKSDYEIQYTEDELNKPWSCTTALKKREVRKHLRATRPKLRSSNTRRKGIGRIPIWAWKRELVNEIIDAILALDAEDEFANKVVASQFFSEDDEDEIKKEEKKKATKRNMHSQALSWILVAMSFKSSLNALWQVLWSKHWHLLRSLFDHQQW